MKTRSTVSLLIGALFLISCLILWKVVPVFAEHWLASRGELPVLLRYFVKFSQVTGQWGLLILMAGLLAVYFVWKKARS